MAKRFLSRLQPKRTWKPSSTKDKHASTAIRTASSAWRVQKWTRNMRVGFPLIWKFQCRKSVLHIIPHSDSLWRDQESKKHHGIKDRWRWSFSARPLWARHKFYRFGGAFYLSFRDTCWWRFSLLFALINFQQFFKHEFSETHVRTAKPFRYRSCLVCDTMIRELLVLDVPPQVSDFAALEFISFRFGFSPENSNRRRFFQLLFRSH